MPTEKTDNPQEVMKFHRIMVAFVFANLIVFLGLKFLLGISIVTPLIAFAGLCAFALFSYTIFSNTAIGPDMIALSIVGLPAVMVFALQGHPWQIDAHMYFFATLAILVGFKSLRVVLVGAVAIAVHHLSLNYFLPSIIFPDGGNFGRVFFHAVIVVVETAILLKVIYDGKLKDVSLQEAIDEANNALELATHAEKEKLLLQEKQDAESKRVMNAFADQFEEQVGEIVAMVAKTSQDMQGMSSKLAESAQATSQKSSHVAQASMESSGLVNSSASAAEELSASIQEISRNVSDTAKTTLLCSDAAKTSQSNLHHLQQAVARVDGVIQSINDVAEQTNLLALNATIEAARAGDAGKGFAVVASEVKNLANESQKMTEEIAHIMDQIKGSSKETVLSVESIILQIETVNEKTTTVASAVEEQNSATEEISRNIQMASRSTGEVTKNIEAVQEAANESAHSAENVRAASDNLVEQGDNLRASVKDFLFKIRNKDDV